MRPGGFSLDRRLLLDSGRESGLRAGLTLDEAAERYSALLSPELYHLLTVDRSWSPSRYEAWVADLLDRDLLR